MWAAVTEWDTAPSRFDRILDVLVEMPAAARAAAQAHLDTALDRAWARGWAPTDVLHTVGRRFSGRHVEVTAARVVADGHRRTERGQHLPRAWQQQLHTLEGRDRPTDSPRPGETVRLLVEVVSLLVRLAEVPPTIPRPGHASAGPHTDGGHLDPRMLGRVRALGPGHGRDGPARVPPGRVEALDDPLVPAGVPAGLRPTHRRTTAGSHRPRDVGDHRDRNRLVPVLAAAEQATLQVSPHHVTAR